MLASTLVFIITQKNVVHCAITKQAIHFKAQLVSQKYIFIHVHTVIIQI